ncbi:UNVERIFIED_CONTAM: uncharacterized protein DUF2233 [Acetivibrio alkalicellulosi]
MRYIGKKISILLVLAIILIFSFSGTNANTIYETSTIETITSGVTLERITQFTNEGWQKINVLRVDLSNINVKVDTISNKDSLNNLTNTKLLAESHGAVAAINGGFFSWMSQAGKGYSDGPVVASGQLISADHEYNRYNNSMATFALDTSNNVLYNFWKTDMELIAPNGKSSVVTQYNKPSSKDYNDISIWNRRMGTSSLGVSEDYPDIVEMVVEHGIVTDIRNQLHSVEIPENGYVVITRGDRGSFITNNFRVGDFVNFSIKTNPEWEDLHMAVTGSAILVKNGAIPSSFSFNINGRHPRTLIGSSHDGKQLLLVTVDGRQEGSLGMTQTESASLMLRLGAYNAINLDGGGSTTMVARTPGTETIQIVNSPSGGSPRNVSNAVGLFSMFPPYPLEGLIINTIDKNVFVNTSREFTVSGYDAFMNPLTVNQSQVQWSVSGVEGSFIGNVFYPKSAGNAVITATVGNVRSSINVKVLSAPQQIILSDKSINMSVDQVRSISARGKDNNGYFARISSRDINWSLSGAIGELEINTFTAKQSGTGYITASIGNTKAHCTISVAKETVQLIDSFEELNGSFLSSPTTIPGSYKITDEIKRSGNRSGKLSYDFNTTDGTRAAYLVFPDEGINLEKNTTKISFWAYNSHENPNWLRGEVVDENGNKHFIDFSRSLDWYGWNHVEASLSNISSPAKLTRIYLVQVNPVTVSGSLYLDDLSITTASYPIIDANKIPKDTVPAYEANRQVELTEDDLAKRFLVFGSRNKANNLLERLLLNNLSHRTTSDTHSIDTKFISKYNSYKSYDENGCRFIQLDTSKNSIRTSSTGQWQWFLKQLNSFSGNNVFIFMENSIDSFSDKLELELFKTVLSEHVDNGKNIWVFSNGKDNSVVMENGIKYIASAGLNVSKLTPDNADTVVYFEITIKDNDVTYQVKPLI